METSTLDDIFKRLQELRAELEEEIEAVLLKKRAQFGYTLEQGKVRFEQGIKLLQHQHKVGVWLYLSAARMGHILTAPVIYSLIIPFVLLDLMVTLYQQVCFRVYGIPLVARGDYIIIDRHQLGYLNVIQKINCVYCGYGNGLIEYSREVAARTEQYWCPIKHARRSPDPHRLADGFVDFGDAESFRVRLKDLQQEIASLKQQSQSRRPE